MRVGDSRLQDRPQSVKRCQVRLTLALACNLAREAPEEAFPLALERFPNAQPILRALLPKRLTRACVCPLFRSARMLKVASERNQSSVARPFSHPAVGIAGDKRYRLARKTCPPDDSDKEG